MERKSLFIIAFLALFFGLASGTQRQKPHFALSYIRSPFHPKLQWALEPLSAFERELLKKIVSQDFNYLGSGSEMFAFVSADGKYVLKFFKMKRLLAKNWFHWIPLSVLEQYRLKMDKRVARQHQLFTNYKMAYENLKEETGLIYIHLNKTKDLKLSLHLYDRRHNHYKIPLDNYEFVIQKKGQPIYDRIVSLMQQGNKEKAAQAIHTFLAHVGNKCRKGYFDQDTGISQNYGFIGDDVIHFDVGRLFYEAKVPEPALIQQELLRVSEKMRTWFQDHYPNLLPDLDPIVDLSFS